LKELFDKHGSQPYLSKIVEELNELACAIPHYLDGKIQTDDLLCEIADVYLQLEKLEAFLDNFSKEGLHERKVFELYREKRKNLEKYL
jgi:NTP pyrophosphatase (non-canonical NTP hydrolase)